MFAQFKTSLAQVYRGVAQATTAVKGSVTSTYGRSHLTIARNFKPNLDVLAIHDGSCSMGISGDCLRAKVLEILCIRPILLCRRFSLTGTKHGYCPIARLFTLRHCHNCEQYGSQDFSSKCKIDVLS